MEKINVCVYTCVCVFVCVCVFPQIDISHKLLCGNYYLLVENNYFAEINFVLLTLVKS